MESNGLGLICLSNVVSTRPKREGTKPEKETIMRVPAINVSTVEEFLKENKITTDPQYACYDAIVEYMATAPDTYTLEDWLKDTKENHPEYLFIVEEEEVEIPEALEAYLNTAERFYTVEHVKEYIDENYPEYLVAYKQYLANLQMASLIVEYRINGIGCSFEEPVSFIQQELMSQEIGKRLGVNPEYFMIED